MSDFKLPKSYWETRCLIGENYVNALATIIGYAIPSTQAQISELDSQWNTEIDKINAKYKQDK